MECRVGLVEYAWLFGFIAFARIAAMSTLCTALTGSFTQVWDSVTAAF